MAGTWERRGTVTVTQNSKVVIGAGTYWTDAQNGPQVGNTFYGPDGQAHEVAVIRSATELWLADNYKGATAAGAAYQIDTTRVDSVPGLASRVAAVLAFAQGQYGNLDRWTQGGDNEDVTLTSPNGESVTVPSLPKTAKTCRVAVPEHEAKAGAHPISGVTGLQAALDGKAASNVVTVHEAKAGAHPISGVTGLQAALDGKAASNVVTVHEAKAGAHPISGVTGLQAALDGKAASNVVTVHEAKAGAHPISGVTGLQAALDGKLSTSGVVGLVANGAVIEQGSNANGGYVKFADGTMICTSNRINSDKAPLNKTSAGWWWESFNTTHPVRFESVPKAAPSFEYSDGSYGAIPATAGVWETGAVVVLYTGASGRVAGGYVSLTTIGRWK